MKKIVIHIGTHKTGTTSFQMSMKVNKKSLESQGIRPILSPVMENGLITSRKTANHIRFGHMLLRQEILTPGRYSRRVAIISSEERHSKLEAFAKRLAYFEEETLLISTESLCFLRTTNEQDLLKRFIDITGRELSTIVVFRNEKDWRESWNAELSKYQTNTFEKIHIESPETSILGHWYFDKDAIRKFWEPFNLRQINYEEHSNIVESLYSTMNINSENIKTCLFKNIRS
jgi:hypothetical protein